MKNEFYLHHQAQFVYNQIIHAKSWKDTLVGNVENTNDLVV